MPDEIEGQEDSVDANLALLVAEAREQLNVQLATVDAQATKSLAITAVDLAGIGLVIASRATLSPWYWAPTITALALSVAALVVPVVTVPIKDGPDLVRFYVSHIRQPPYQAKLAMYELLLQSIDSEPPPRGRLAPPILLGRHRCAGAASALDDCRRARGTLSAWVESPESSPPHPRLRASLASGWSVYPPSRPSRGRSPSQASTRASVREARRRWPTRRLEVPVPGNRGSSVGVPPPTPRSASNGRERHLR